MLARDNGKFYSIPMEENLLDEEGIGAIVDIHSSYSNFVIMGVRTPRQFTMNFYRNIIISGVFALRC
jgi:hypothetical protein